MEMAFDKDFDIAARKSISDATLRFAIMRDYLVNVIALIAHAKAAD